MRAQFTHAIKFVADMETAVAFYRDTLGLTVRFTSPDWSEFETGAVTLALHPETSRNAAGEVQLGFTTPDLEGIYADRDGAGLVFAAPPVREHGVLLSRLVDCEGAEISLSGT